MQDHAFNFQSSRTSLVAQRGAVLFVVLLLLFVLTLLAITVTKTTVLETRVSANVQNKNLALQSAEAALRGAEADILQSKYAESAFTSNANGLYLFDPTNGSNLAYLGINWASPGNTVINYDGPTLAGNITAAKSEFLIQQLPAVAVPGESTTYVQYGFSATPVNVYQITAYGVGGDQNASAKLQSIFH